MTAGKCRASGIPRSAQSGASFEADKEAPVIFGHGGDHRGDDRFPRGFKVRERDRLLRHAGKAPFELFTVEVRLAGAAGRGENFGHGIVCG